MKKDKAQSAKTPAANPASADSAKGKLAKPSTGPATPVLAEPTTVERLFRPVDWLVFGLTTLAVMAGYMWTLAPNQTLEDSGELATASMYAGIPHPPGYPVWTIFTWVFATFLPMGNIAWRVGVSCAVAGALSCGIIGMMVSRGSSWLFDSLPELKDLDRKLEWWLCLAAGFVGGTLMGFNGYFWSQAVIVEVYTLSVLSLVGVMVCLMRWLHAPHQYRYLYFALFIFGICFTNHQTLIVAAIGIEILVAAARPKLGRDLFLGNSLLYLLALMLKQQGHLSMFTGNPPLWVIFNVIGVFSLITCVWLIIQTRSLLTEWAPVLIMGLLWILGAGFYFFMPVASMGTPPLNWGYPRTVEGFFHALTRGQYEKANPANIIAEPDRFAGQIWQYFIGCVDEFNLVYLAIGLVPFIILAVSLRRDGAMKDMRMLGMINAGLVALFLLAAYLSAAGKLGNVTAKSLVQMVWWFIGVLMLADLLVLVHVMIRFLQRRERAWMVGLGTIYLGLALLLLILLNPAPDRQSKELNRVFFTSSHVMLAMWSAYGLALLGALLATQYERFRRAFMWLAGGSAMVATYAVVIVFSNTPSWRERGETGFDINRAFDLTPFSDPVSRGTALLGLGLALVALFAVAMRKQRAPMAVLLGLFFVLPAKSVLSHWWDNEQRGHLYGYWFGHDMFTPPFKDKAGKPLYPEMDRDTVLFGGTDPGRFNPTYMIYCESFIASKHRQEEDPNFDRRDVYLITQNALADATYLSYIRAHYNRSAQRDPAFFTEFFKTDLVSPIEDLFQGIGDKVETSRRGGSSLFEPEHFTDLAGFAARLKPGATQDPLSKFIYSKLSDRARELVDKSEASSTLGKVLARELNAMLTAEFEARRALQRDLDGILVREIDAAKRDAALQDVIGKYRENKDWLLNSNHISHLQFTPRLQRLMSQGLPTAARLRMTRQVLEESYPKLIAKSEGGVYPDFEILTPTIDDSQQAFQEYIMDAQRRKAHDDNPQLRHEPRQIKPGEDIRIDNGRVQVAGQVAVMAINGLLTKVIFDKNPAHEFYVEESFPLDWMYPYLTPFGIIMKINRQPLVELTDEHVNRDKEFWMQYSDRLIGNWIKEDTSVSNICAWAEQVYLRRDLRNYTGSSTFIRDDNAQKAFSKLRSAIGGVYAWRINTATYAMQAKQQEISRPGANVGVLQAEINRLNNERNRMIAAADFTYRQAFAYCPYSPEATFRYINLLMSMGRMDDAYLIGKTCFKLDPENPAIANLVDQLAAAKDGRSVAPAAATPAPAVAPTGIAGAFQQIQQLINQNRRPEAVAMLDQLLASPAADAQAVMNIAQAYLMLQEMPRLEGTMRKMVAMMPDSPEAYYDLAAVQAVVSKPDEAVTSLATALKMSGDRLAKPPAPGQKINDLRAMARGDARLAVLRNRADFQKLLPDYAPAVAPAPPQLPPGVAQPPAVPIPVVPVVPEKK